MSQRCVYVLYGSQTGNAESVAKEVAEKLSREGIQNICCDLNSAKAVCLKELALCLIVVCSTTGNGDSPENANDWWRAMKIRSLAKDTFEGVPFAVLGLGDTNYDKFCYMGKSIDKRLCELGGKRCLSLHCADEGTGLEETIEAWKRAVMATVKKIHTESVAAAEPNDEEKIGEDSQKSLEAEHSDKLGSCTSDASSRAYTPLNECSSGKEQFQATMPANVLSVPQLGAMFNITEKLSTAPTAAQLPKAKPCAENKSPFQLVAVDAKDLVAGIAPSSESKQSTACPTPKDYISDGTLWTAEHPFHAAVVAAKWLTTDPPGKKAEWGEDRRVIHLELSLAGSQISYTPGDSIGICCPNAPYAVDIVLRRLQEAHPEALITPDTLVSCAADGTFVTLHEVLSYKYDLMGQPKKASMVLLAQCCTDPAESVLLQHLCSKADTGKVLWEQFIEKQRMGLAEVLAMFPSCTPKLHQLLACLTCLPPRYYSISSSPLTSQNRVTVAFSVVRYTCKADARPEGEPPVDIKRSGLCTTYLENLLRPLLRAREAVPYQESDIAIRVFHKVSLNFHLPGSVAPPLILIGPGTGVAPFMGFLEHRTQLALERRRSSSEDCCTGMWRGGFELEEEDLPAEGSCVQQFIDAVEPGPVFLFFGCRNEHDYLYRSELQEHLSTRVLTELEVAMSRVGPEKVYVTHKLRDRAGEIARMVLEDQAHIYICGDGNSMAKDVYCTIKAILSKHAGLTDEETEAMLQDMKLRRRYVLDIWS